MTPRAPIRPAGSTWSDSVSRPPASSASPTACPRAGPLVSSSVLVPALGGLVLLGLFVARSLRIEHPLLDLNLLANPAFRSAAIVTFCLGAALFGGMILMPLYFQTIRGEDAIQTGLLLIPQGIGGGLGMFLSGRLTTRLGAGRTSMLGGLILAAATVPFILVTAG